MKRIYCDGGCAPTNPGPGGWAWLLADGSAMGIGGQEHATNNQMELYAIRKALECNSGDIAILSDSQYALGVCLRRIRPFVDHLGLKHQIVELARGRLVTFEHVARQKNEAHHLVAMARKRLTV